MVNYVVEALNIGKNIDMLDVKPRYIRYMFGPFDSFDEATKWMDLHVTDYETIVIHNLHDPYSPLPSKEEDTPRVYKSIEGE